MQEHSVNKAPHPDRAINNTSVPFGDLRIPRSSEVLVAPQELAVYRSGFAIYRKLLAVENMPTDKKKFLLSPATVSGIIGFQPFLSLSLNEANVLAGIMQEANINISDNFAMIQEAVPTTNGGSREAALLLNIPAARLILDQHASLLGVDFPEDATRNWVVETVLDLLTIEDDVLRFHVASGLLSGFPISDVRPYAEESAQNNRPLPAASGIKKSIGGSADVEKESLLVRAKVMQDTFREIPLYVDDREVEADATGTGLHPSYELDDYAQAQKFRRIHGYGLRWFTELDANKQVDSATIKFCQKLVQIDDAIGLEEFMVEQRKLLAA